MGGTKGRNPARAEKTCRGRPSRMVDAAFLDIRTESNNDVVKIMEANGTVPNRSAVPDGNLVVENDARIHLGIEGDHRKREPQQMTMANRLQRCCGREMALERGKEARS
ncbi:hypothetical protein HPP92_021362 [Vanilla planifolia]|uniref:Uncharacterized protein n=1 Tax=Vanilla planifolia TaxID=51239 RepID=A0A835UHH4_VANPL|nr:hypothetical protein HPP92_021362 [Vanilla planifolia]